MATPRRRPRSTPAGAPTLRREEPTPRKKAGRPKGPPSTIVNLRLPLELWHALIAISTGWRATPGSRRIAG